MTKFFRALMALMALVLALGGVALISSPAQAACGDTVAQWVDPVLGSAWSGSVGSNSLTAVHTNAVNASATVVGGLTGSGVGTWAKPYSQFQWTASAAGVWYLSFAVSADSCSAGKVTTASGGASDPFGSIYSVLVTRTL